MVEVNIKTNPELSVEYKEQGRSMTCLEYNAVITNNSDKTIELKDAVLLEIEDLSQFDLGEGPYSFYRSGRHKNDMPGVFTFGKKDERFLDVASVMAESGDMMDGDGSVSCVVSDHLSIIKGSEKALVVSFLTGRDQLFDTTVYLDDNGEFQKLVARVLFNIELAPGKSVTTETIRIAVVDDVEAEIDYIADYKVKLYGKRNDRHPAVFCTWYYYGLTVTYEDVMTNLNIMKERKLPFDVYQVDEGWEVTLGEYAPNHKFPVPMKQIADDIKAAGYVAGIWSSPFVAHETATIWKKHPEWILKDKSGNPYLFPMNDTVYYVFDITNPRTYEYFTELYRMFTFDWGYTYHKLDFTRAAVIYEEANFYDKTVTLAQAYYRAVKAIREGMGDDTFFLMCGGLYDPIIGLVDAQRTGSDVLSMWSSTINKGGKTAPYTIRQSVMRYYLNKFWANDPDALMIRKNETMERNLRLTYGLLNDEEVKTSVINQFMGGGIMCMTEPLDKVTDDRLMEIKHILPVVDTDIRPLDICSADRFPGPVDVYIPSTDVHCACIINWSDTDEMDACVDLSKLDLDKNYKYIACNFYSGEHIMDISAASVIKLGTINPHGATVIKLEKITDKPIIVASDGHYSMGAEFDTIAYENGELIMHKKNILPVTCNYKVYVPGVGVKDVSI